MIVEEDNIRLDIYLKNHTNYSRSLIENLIKTNKILVNEKQVKPSYKVRVGDNITILDVKMDMDIPSWDKSLDIVYEDKDIMVINKPSGMSVHPGAGNYDRTLVNALKHYTDKLSDIGGVERLGIVHRLDKDTSGLMLVARSNEAHKILSEDFAKHSIKRTYIALLVGVLPQDKITIEAPIGRDKNNRLKYTVTSINSKSAITHLTVLKRYQNYTLVKLNLETGRTHQIRVHTKYIGYPVYNDPLYGTSYTSFGQFLHSSSIKFIHPITKKEMYFETPLPKEFQEYLDTLD